MDLYMHLMANDPNQGRRPNDRKHDYISLDVARRAPFVVLETIERAVTIPITNLEPKCDNVRRAHRAEGECAMAAKALRRANRAEGEFVIAANNWAEPVPPK